MSIVDQAQLIAAFTIVEAASSRGCGLVLEQWSVFHGKPGAWSALFWLPDGHDSGQHVGATPLEAVQKAWEAALEMLTLDVKVEVP